MTDLDLLLFGCVVSFVAAAGAYVAIREGFGYTRPASHPEVERRAERARARESLLGGGHPGEPAEEGASGRH